MLTDGFIRLIQCHVLLNDNPSRVAQFDSIVQSNIDWFFQNASDQVSPGGSAIKLWLYAIGGSVEDANHFAYEAQGLWIAYESGRYGVKFKDIVPFANTYVDMILGIYDSSTGKYAGKVDGTTGSGNSGGDNYVRDEYIYLTEFRPDQFTRFATINSGKIASSHQITARLLWEKNRRYQAQANQVDLPAQACVVTPGHKSTQVVFGDVTLQWTGSINTASYNVYVGTSPDNLQYQDEVTGTSLVIPSLPANTKYYWRVDAINNMGEVTGEVYYFTTYDPDNIPPDPTPDQIRVTGNGGTMTAQYGSSSVPAGTALPVLHDLDIATKFFIAGKTALWIQYESTVPAALSTYVIVSGNDRPARDPKSWTVKGSNDLVTWVTLDERENESFNARGQANYYIVNDETKYKYFRLYITENAGEENTQLAEWNIYQSKTLPVELLTFNARKQQNGVLLSWQTASEANNDQFILYRSGDGKQFSPIDTISGATYSAQMLSYSFLDKDPLAGNNYYRLVQYDLNGSVTDLGTRVISFGIKDARLVVYPNPFNGSRLKFRYKAVDAHLTVRLTDLTGKIVYRKIIPVNDLEEYVIDFPVQLAAGFYILNLQDEHGDFGEQAQVIVQR
ncbi:T9SS type A sorting domain-containing protein [Pedobacter sp. BS3]|uniref:T9SS type A sorting domain-containing protein n=1 Tax=Pedobacter sp. BS3 TaxID=2567937 RepID=UPI0011ECB532|nr:T9SS type A sorting domain-containing protein [Pedobacter sp. BS3]TZF83103.1 T9SS type A sorting domain-containing protein [Pedobacter sp. BS3]